MGFRAWLLSRSISSLRFIHVVVGVRASLLCVVGPRSAVWMGHILSSRSPVRGHLGGFPLLAVVNRAAMSIHVRFWAASLSPGFLGSRRGVEQPGRAGALSSSPSHVPRVGGRCPLLVCVSQGCCDRLFLTPSSQQPAPGMHA